MYKIRSVRYNFIMNFILTASSFIFPLITFPYISRVLLADGNGKIAFVTSYVNYFLMFASLGIPTYGIRACAKLRDDAKKLSTCVLEIMTINVITTILVAIVYVLTLFFVPRLFADRTLFLINTLTLFLNLIGVNWLFQALEQYEYITKRSLAFKLLSLVLMFIFVHNTSDYVIYGIIAIIAASGSNILNFIKAFKIIDVKNHYPLQFKSHLKPIFILFAQNLAISVYTNLDVLMLGFMKNDVEVGFYNAAIKLKFILISFVTSLSGVLLPRMSYLVKTENKKEFDKLVIKALNFVLFIATPIAIIFTIISRDNILILAGSSFLPATPTMALLTLTILPIGITNVLGIQILTPIEEEKKVMISVIFGAVIDFVLNFLFIPKWGASGAALSTLIAEILVLIVQIYYTKNLLLNVVKKVRIARYLILSFLASIPSFILMFTHFSNPIIRILISTTSFALIYLGILNLLKDDLTYELFSLFKKRRKV